LNFVQLEVGVGSSKGSGPPGVSLEEFGFSQFDSIAEVRSRLSRSGLRVTSGRQAVYRTLAALGGHRSADEVHDALVEDGEGVSRTSVYSTLEVLTRVGLVMAADAGPGRALYEANEVWHHHAVCRVCGSVSDVECVIGAKPCLEAYGDWGDVDEAQVIFRGTCRSCSTEAPRT
jgi:Fe2+ or Zn2+ uptake regulation protein